MVRLRIATCRCARGQSSILEGCSRAGLHPMSEEFETLPPHFVGLTEETAAIVKVVSSKLFTNMPADLVKFSEHLLACSIHNLDKVMVGKFKLSQVHVLWNKPLFTSVVVRDSLERLRPLVVCGLLNLDGSGMCATGISAASRNLRHTAELSRKMDALHGEFDVLKGGIGELLSRPHAAIATAVDASFGLLPNQMSPPLLPTEFGSNAQVLGALQPPASLTQPPPEVLCSSGGVKNVCSQRTFPFRGGKMCNCSLPCTFGTVVVHLPRNPSLPSGTCTASTLLYRGRAQDFIQA